MTLLGVVWPAQLLVLAEVVALFVTVIVTIASCGGKKKSNKDAAAANTGSATPKPNSQLIFLPPPDPDNPNGNTTLSNMSTAAGMTTEPVQTGTKMSTVGGQSTTEGPKGKSTAEAQQGTTASEMPKAASYGGDGGGDGYENLSNRNQKK